MFGKLLPRETSFFDFFEQHAKLTIEGAKEFLSLAQTGASSSRARPRQAVWSGFPSYRRSICPSTSVTCIQTTWVSPSLVGS